MASNKKDAAVKTRCAECLLSKQCEQSVVDDNFYCATCWTNFRLSGRQQYDVDLTTFGGGQNVTVEVALRNGDGQVLALVLRNVDGAFGSKMLADAAIRLEDTEMEPGGRSRSSTMAGASRCSGGSPTAQSSRRGRRTR